MQVIGLPTVAQNQREGYRLRISDDISIRLHRAEQPLKPVVFTELI